MSYELVCGSGCVECRTPNVVCTNNILHCLPAEGPRERGKGSGGQGITNTVS